MTRDQAIAKIKKCLALGRSANEHEAAAALRQAQALMRDHGITELDARLSDVSERSARGRSVSIIRWEAMLASVIDEAFGVQHFSSTRWIGMSKRRRDVVFVGVGLAAELAAYAFDVLARQCAASRTVYIGKQPKNCKPSTRTARGDAFAEGWVIAVRTLVQRFAGNPGDQLLIEQHIAATHPTLTSVAAKNRAVGKSLRDVDLNAGYSSGKSAKLDKGLPGAVAVPLLG